MTRLALMAAFACVLAGAAAAAPDPGAGDTRSLVHLALAADTETPYVQAQVLLTLRMARSIGNRRLALPVPRWVPELKTRHAIVEHLRDRDTRRVVRRNGLRYLITVRHYALFPQTANAMTVGPVTFQGPVATRAGGLTRATARSNTITLHVRPVPDSFTGEFWLPAKSVDTYQGFRPDELQLVIGTPISRRLALTVHGAHTGALPAFQPPSAAGLQARVFKPLRKEHPTKSGLVATLRQKIALVPTETGQVKIPSIQVPWWNTVTDRQEIARFPGYTLTVTPATAGWGAGESPPSSGPSPADRGLLSTAATKFHRLLWALGAAAVITVAVLLAGLLLVDWRRVLFRQSRLVPVAWVRWRLKRRALRACRANNPAQAADAILRLAATVGATAGQGSLRQLAGDVPPPLGAELLALNMVMYGPRQLVWNGRNMARALRHWPGGRAPRTHGRYARALPELHPLAGGR